MSYLLTGLSIFFIAHIFSSLTKWRALLISRIGDKPYKIIYALLSLSGFALIVIGLGEPNNIQLYQPASWSRPVTVLLMLIAIASYLSFVVPTNLRRVTAHPMMWGVLIWSVAHLLSNGNTMSVIVFISFFLYSIYVITMGNMRGAKPSGTPIPWKRDLVKGLMVIGVFFTLIYFHKFFTGTALIP